MLAGLVRCRRCGRKLTVRYTGAKHNIPRYSCWRGLLDNGEPRCIAFGGLRVDDAIEEALLRVVQPGAIVAAAEPEAQAASEVAFDTPAVALGQFIIGKGGEEAGGPPTFLSACSANCGQITLVAGRRSSLSSRLSLAWSIVLSFMPHLPSRRR